MITIFGQSLAEIKRCSEKHNQLDICFTSNEGYENPYPLALNTYFRIQDIISVNENENSFTLQVFLWTQWIDPGLSSTKNFTG